MKPPRSWHIACTHYPSMGQTEVFLFGGNKHIKPDEEERVDAADLRILSWGECALTGGPRSRTRLECAVVVLWYTGVAYATCVCVCVCFVVWALVMSGALSSQLAWLHRGYQMRVGGFKSYYKVSNQVLGTDPHSPTYKATPHTKHTP